MNRINTCFLQLLAVSLGNRDSLTFIPTTKEWEAVFRMAQEQAMVGVCFAGVRRLKGQDVCPPRPLYMQWFGMAVQIHQQNELMNLWSEEICKEIGASGIHCSILKGQAVAELYVKNEKKKEKNFRSESGDENDGLIDLRMLRQSGDIDVWMLASHKEVIRWGQSHGVVWFYDYHHADLIGFHDVEVEMHYRPTLSRNLWRNARLQKWLRQGERLIENGEKSFPVPTAEFALILTLNHNFWHLMYEGVGMRQMMDLYFVLRTQVEELKERNEKWVQLVDYFGLTTFAKASMWVMKEVFGLRNEFLVCAPEERSGRFLLDEILRAGNFGHADKRLKHGDNENRLVLMVRWLKHTWRLFRDYPADVLWTPIGVLYISLWRRWHYRFDHIKLDTNQ